MSQAALLAARFGREPVSAYVDDRWDLLTLPYGAIPYRLVGRTAITVGAPLGPPERAGRATAAFLDHCHARGWRPVVFHSPRPVPGLRSYLVGTAAIIDVDSFTLKCPLLANVRHSVGRAGRAGVMVSWTRWAEMDPALRRQVKVVSDQWSGRGVKLTFTYGRFDDIPASAVVGIAHGPGHRIEAFTTWRRLPAGGGLVLDLTRRRPDSVPGCMDLLVSQAVDLARAEGLGWLSLGVSATGVDGPPWLALPARLARRWNADGLRRFKAKFHPRFEERYLALPGGPDSAVALAALGFAHIRAPRVALADVRLSHDKHTGRELCLSSSPRQVPGPSSIKGRANNP